mmetsp:Transcript_7037/g.20594  ORF Transcript_7037/g.20594 Transcript_7037/m.20594 type:complete len:246 (+) Transcript_7037:357-1094(+)
MAAPAPAPRRGATTAGSASRGRARRCCCTAGTEASATRAPSGAGSCGRASARSAARESPASRGLRQTPRTRSCTSRRGDGTPRRGGGTPRRGDVSGRRSWGGDTRCRPLRPPRPLLLHFARARALSTFAAGGGERFRPALSPAATAAMSAACLLFGIALLVLPFPEPPLLLWLCAGLCYLAPLQAPAVGWRRRGELLRQKRRGDPPPPSRARCQCPPIETYRAMCDHCARRGPAWRVNTFSNKTV